MSLSSRYICVDILYACVYSNVNGKHSVCMIDGLERSNDKTQMHTYKKNSPSFSLTFFLSLSLMDPNILSVFDTFLSHPHTHTHTHTHTPLQAERVKLEACLGIFFLNLYVSAVYARVLAEALLCHGNTNF